MNLPRRSAWIGHGFWNVLEHGLARGMDAVATLAILWCVPTTVFSQLALAQAYVAPALFLFISPETALYRHFSEWTKEGQGALLTRVRVFRRFAWFKGVAALALAAIISASFPSPSGTSFNFFDRFFALVWAFSLSLLPQIAGPDREFLRLSLNLKTLNGLTFFQRAIYLVLLVPAAKFFPESIALIASCGAGTTLITAWVARQKVETYFVGTLPAPVSEGNGIHVVRHALQGFSLWNHFSGIITGWLQTLDLFFLGWFRIPAADLGLYSVALKLSNFTLAIPYAITNLYQVYLGRTQPAGRTEVSQLVRFSLGMVAFAAFQARVVYELSPWILSVFSRGRWTDLDQGRMLVWLQFFLPAFAIFASALFWNGWLSIRTSYQRLIFSVYLPWGVGGLLLYGAVGRTGNVDAMARMNVVVMGLFVVLLAISSLSLKKSSRPA